MQSKKLAKPKPGPPTQRFLDIAEIRENVVILKDGTMRAVLMCSSINFALKSEDEQQAIIQGYMQFLNGLEYPIQVVIQSRKMNIDGYLERLKAQEDSIHNELLKAQIRDYTSFIKELVDLGEIMQKRFFVVVPFDPLQDKQKGFMTKLSAAISPASLVKLNDKTFRERRDRLQHRVETVASGLTSMGLQTAMLDTQGLIELYYTVYNPDTFDNEKMADVGKLQVETKF
ncbi:MAG: TraC family protein [Patescibacteria group bacterium]